MHDLIFRFLLESGFPRGSILNDYQGDSPEENQGLGYRPAFLIVDPDTADTLAVIDVVESGTTEQLHSVALHAGRFAAHASEGGVQSFVIQVDEDNPDSSEQVRFYKLLAGKKMQQISSYAFPDLEYLQVARKLKNKQHPGEALKVDDDLLETSNTPDTDRSTQVLYFLALLLVLICVVDWTLMQTRGMGIFTLQQILLLISASALLAIPILARQFRRSR